MKKLRKQVLQAVAYVQDFLTFFFLDSAIKNNVRSIYLYGSAARGVLEKNSDVDVFVDCTTNVEKEVQGIANAALSRFYASHDAEKWRLLKFMYPISVQTGDLKSWSLQDSVLAEGIVLFSSTSAQDGSNRSVLFRFVLPKRKKEYIHVKRLLFGRKEKNYNDNGLLGKSEGERISGNVFFVPKEAQQDILQFMHKYKLDFSMKECVVFGV